MRARATRVALGASGQGAAFLAPLLRAGPRRPPGERFCPRGMLVVHSQCPRLCSASSNSKRSAGHVWVLVTAEDPGAGTDVRGGGKAERTAGGAQRRGRGGGQDDQEVHLCKR